MVLSVFFMIVHLSVVWNPSTLDNCVNALYVVFSIINFYWQLFRK